MESIMRRTSKWAAFMALGLASLGCQSMPFSKPFRPLSTAPACQKSPKNSCDDCESSAPGKWNFAKMRRDKSQCETLDSQPENAEPATPPAPKQRTIVRPDVRPDVRPNCEQCQFEQPRELKKVSLPDYIIEPPDILLIEATNSLRPATAALRVGETVLIQATNTLPVDAFDDDVVKGFKQINGAYRIHPDGQVHLGPEYGSVPVRGLSIAEAQRAIELQLKQTLRTPRVYVTMPTDQAAQHIAGQHLVRPDGTVALGIYGSVYISGMTLDAARRHIERHLSQHIYNPEVTVDVLSYNSKVYYVVTDGAGAGEQVYRFPCTGNETVLDALAQINGLPQVASKKHIWIARPAPPELGQEQVLEVDWDGIVRGGQSKTNFQILPGDRLYVRADDLVSFDTAIAKITAPLERIAGFALLGNGTVRSLQRGRNAKGGGL